MSSPRLGVVRDSMTTNPLLIKAPLGQSRSRGLLDVDPDFTFGTSSSSLRDGGVAEVLSSWAVQSSRGCSAPRRPAPPDFLSLNRDAVRSGLVTAKELARYRAQGGGARTRPHAAPRPQEGGASQRPAVPDITFGVTRRPSSPLCDLLSHQYGQRWIQQQLSRNRTCDPREQQRSRAGCVPDTRTSLLRRSRALPAATHTPGALPPPRCTLPPRCTQVPPSLDTFRDQEARAGAFRARQSFRASRVKSLD